MQVRVLWVPSSERVLKCGEVADLPDDVARHMIMAGEAEPVIPASTEPIAAEGRGDGGETGREGDIGSGLPPASFEDPAVQDSFAAESGNGDGNSVTSHSDAAVNGEQSVVDQSELGSEGSVSVAGANTAAAQTGRSRRSNRVTKGDS